MKEKDIKRFFSALARSWPHRTDCILIGGAVALLEGGQRPTTDVDFEVKFGGTRSVNDPDAFASAIRDAESASGLLGQFTEDFSGWSPVTLPSYRGKKRRWKSFGPITVWFLDPPDYILTKLRRGAAHDFTDLILVARKKHVSWRSLAMRCAAAVRSSPKSTHLRSFIRRVEYLFRVHGRTIWGKRFDAKSAVDLFQGKSVRRTLHRKS